MSDEPKMISRFTYRDKINFSNNDEVLYQGETFIVFEKNDNWYIHPTGNTDQGDIPLDEVYDQLEIVQ